MGPTTVRGACLLLACGLVLGTCAARAYDDDDDFRGRRHIGVHDDAHWTPQEGPHAGLHVGEHRTSRRSRTHVGVHEGLHATPQEGLHEGPHVGVHGGRFRTLRREFIGYDALGSPVYRTR